MTIELSTTDRRDGKALALFARCAEWQTGHSYYSPTRVGLRTRLEEWSRQPYRQGE